MACERTVGLIRAEVTVGVVSVVTMETVWVAAWAPVVDVGGATLRLLDIPVDMFILVETELVGFIWETLPLLG